MWTRWFALAVVLGAASGWAQTDMPDASLPDASVGEGGADHASEENDPNNLPCLTSATCDHGTFCDNGRCVPKPVQVASCGGAPMATLLLGAAAVALVAGKRR